MYVLQYIRVLTSVQEYKNKYQVVNYMYKQTIRVNDKTQDTARETHEPDTGA